MSNIEPTNGPEPVKHGFQNFEFAAADIVLAASFNTAGNRAIICSADHKIRVYNVDGNSAWTLADVWRGHDAEVLDVSLL
jgi:WD40 repeat protein